MILRIVPVVSKKCSDDRDDHMETLTRRSQGDPDDWDDVNRLDRIEFYPDDRDVNFVAIRIVCDRLCSVSIWSSRSSEHFLRRLGAGSGQSYGNQALRDNPLLGWGSWCFSKKEEGALQHVFVLFPITLKLLSSGNADGDGDAETCKRTRERTPLWWEFTKQHRRDRCFGIVKLI